MKKRIALAMACLLLSASISGVLYGLFVMTTPTLENVFTVGSVKIRLTEPHYDPSGNTPMVQGQTVGKDPVITNTGTNSAFVWLEVEVPKETVRLLTEAGAPEEKEEELFSLDGLDDKNWVLVESRPAGEGKTMTYVYGYASILPSEGDGRTTEPLFQTVTYKKILEDSQEAHAYSIDVRAYGIQTTLSGLEHSGGKLTAEDFKTIISAYAEDMAEE